MALGDPTLHQDLMNTMAQRQGFDLYAKRASGAVSGRDLDDMLTRCRGCGDASGCKKSLDAGGMPDTCANDSRWDALRELTRM
jgi:hypothetical protein